MPNVFVPLGKGAGFEEARAVINANFAQLDNEALTKVFKRAGGNAIVNGRLPGDTGYGFLLYGTDGLVAIACYVDSDGNPILKVAKEGYDALTATDDQLIFNSSQNVFKIVNTVDVSLNVVLTGTGAATASATVAHGLSYTPAYNAFITIDPTLAALSPIPAENGPNPFLVMTTTAGGLTVIGFLQVSVNATNVTFAGQISASGSATLSNSATVYLYQESAS